MSCIDVLDFRRCGVRETFALYERLALLCCAGHVLDGVLVRAGEEDPEQHYALRDVLRIVARVNGGPLGLRIAAVGEDWEALGNVFRIMVPELRALGCDVRFFPLESEAAAWLRACSSGSAPPAPPLDDEAREHCEHDARAD